MLNNEVVKTRGEARMEIFHPPARGLLTQLVIYEPSNVIYATSFKCLVEHLLPSFPGVVFQWRASG